MLTGAILALLLDADAALRLIFNDPNRPSVILGETGTPDIGGPHLQGSPDLPLITCFTEIKGAAVSDYCVFDYGPGTKPIAR